MKFRIRIIKYLSFIVALSLLSAPTFADKPSHAGKGKGKYKTEKVKGKSNSDTSIHVFFNSDHRLAIKNYYSSEFKAGNCPPGLAKKNNGCLPPGQAKKWRRGDPIDSDLTYYDLPRSLVVEIGLPPEGHKYVRIGADILLIAMGTGIVIDAIEDLADIL